MTSNQILDAHPSATGSNTITELKVDDLVIKAPLVRASHLDASGGTVGARDAAQESEEIKRQTDGAGG